MLNNTLT